MISTKYQISSPFEQVSHAIWQKAEFCPQISAVDVLNRKVISGKLQTTRLITTEFKLPRFMHFLSNNISTHALEISTLDPKTQILDQYSVNMSFIDYFICKEHVMYSKENNKTVFESSAEFILHKYLKRMQNEFMNEFSKNAEIGKLALQQAIEMQLNL
eukprot:NODE_210_length_12844_cov_1.045822.p10 type:complete len:159 gc:universal NODE_210_length_12844_cov_1.045822:4162-3686(-)